MIAEIIGLLLAGFLFWGLLEYTVGVPSTSARAGMIFGQGVLPWSNIFCPSEKYTWTFDGLMTRSMMPVPNDW